MKVSNIEMYWDTTAPVKTRDGKNLLIARMLIEGYSKVQMSKATGYSFSTFEKDIMPKFFRRFTHYAYEFDSREGIIIQAHTKALLVERMKKRGFYIKSADVVNNVLHRKDGIYSYHGTFIGQFSKVLMVRKLTKENKSRLTA